MHVSIEISMYPLTPEYEQPIIDFIHRLRENQDIQVHTNQLSTQLVGPYDTILDALREAMRPALSASHTVSFVLKILNVKVEPGMAASV